MINKVVYVGYMPLTTKVKEDFYFQELIDENIQVEYWDLTEIFFKDIFFNKINDTFILEINSYLLLIDFIKSQDLKSTLFVINITFGFQTITLHKILTKYNCKTAFFARGALPIPTRRKRIGNIFFKLHKILYFKLILRQVRNKYTLLLKKKGIIKHHDIVFRAGGSGMQTIGTGSEIENEKSTIIDINLFDYDNYVMSKNSERLLPNKYCVFLDEYLPFHPDFNMFNIKSIDPVEYYKNLNLFFDLIESKFDIKVIISAHPKSDKYKEKDFFNNRKLLYFKSAELVKDSEFVIAHCSTAISFAVLNKKPILLLSMNIIKINMPDYFSMIECFSMTLDAKLVNIDEESHIDIILPKSNFNKYSKYIYEYLTSKTSKDFTSSRIFTETILRF